MPKSISSLYALTVLLTSVGPAFSADPLLTLQSPNITSFLKVMDALELANPLSSSASNSISFEQL